MDQDQSQRVGTYILERVYTLRGLLDLATNDLRNELVRKLRKRDTACLPLDDFDHLLSDGTDLRRGGVCGFLNLILSTLGEGDCEKSKEVIIGGLDRGICLDECLPLADQRSQLVRCKVEAVKVGEAGLSLYFVDSELDLPESMVLVFLQVCERNLDDPSLERIVGILHARCPVHKRFPNTGQVF